MKKIVLLFLGLCFCGAISAQDDIYGANSMPFIDGRVIFSAVEPMNGVSADDLYYAAKVALTDIFAISGDELQIDDKESHLLVVKGLTVKGNTSWEYIIRIQTKDNRYRIEMYDCLYTIVSDDGRITQYPAEILTDEVCLTKKGKCKTLGYGYRRRFLIDTNYDIFSAVAQKISIGTIGVNDVW